MANPLDTFFPRDPAYDGLLSVQRVRDMQRMAAMRAGLGVMGAAATQPFGAALNAGAGPVLENWPKEMSGAAEAAANLAQYHQKADIVARRQQILQQHPQKPGEGEVEYLQRLYPEFLRSGDLEVVGKLTEILKANSGSKASPTPHAGINPTTKMPQMYTLSPNGALEWMTDPTTGLPVSPTERTGQQDIEYMRKFTRENQLNDDYNKTVQPWLVPYGAVQRAVQFKDAALHNDAAAQMQILYAFINTLDNSVVREGEAAMATSAAPLLDRAKKWLAQNAEGKAQLLPQTILTQMVHMLDAVNDNLSARMERYRKHYTRRAQAWGVDPASFIDIPETFKAGSPSAPAPSPTNPLKALMERR